LALDLYLGCFLEKWFFQRLILGVFCWKSKNWPIILKIIFSSSKWCIIDLTSKKLEKEIFLGVFKAKIHCNYFYLKEKNFLLLFLLFPRVDLAMHKIWHWISFFLIFTMFGLWYIILKRKKFSLKRWVNFLIFNKKRLKSAYEKTHFSKKRPNKRSSAKFCA